MEVASNPVQDIGDEHDKGVDLCKGSFSLEYGTLMLIRDAKLHLKRNRFYGLLGQNQCRKTALMRAISSEQLEGFRSATSSKAFRGARD